MQDSIRAAPLHLHTFESICESLLAGLAVPVGGLGDDLCLEQTATRSILDWYRRNPDRWKGQPKLIVRTPDCEEIVDRMLEDPPTVKPPPADDQRGHRRILGFRALRAHRFGGLHRYGGLDDPGPVFEFANPGGITVVEGKNGSGKTSLLSAICWCLTGAVYRSTRPPDGTANALILISQEEEELDPELAITISSVTPIPPAEVLRGIGSQPLRIDTWVEVDLEDLENPDQIFTIRRQLSRRGRNRIEEDVEGLDQLGLDPVSLKLGTQLPAQIPYIDFQKPTDLGLAVASLTGLRPLKELAKHAQRVLSDKLNKELPRARQQEISATEEEYIRECRLLEQLLEPIKGSLKAQHQVPLSASGPEAAEALSQLSDDLETAQSRIYAAATTILGASFDTADSHLRGQLKKDLPVALNTISLQNLARLPSMARLRNLRTLTETEIAKAERLGHRLEGEWNELKDLHANQEAASRARLYQRLAGWLRTQPQTAQDLGTCPVCLRPLNALRDPQSGDLISRHLEVHFEHDKPFLEKTLEAWEREARQQLSADAPEALRREVEAPEPPDPILLVKNSLSSELFEQDEFRGPLAALRPIVEARYADAFAGLPPPFREPGVSDCHNQEASESSLTARLRRMRQALVIARWLQENKNLLKSSVEKIIGTPDAQTEALISQAPSLSSQLKALQELAETTVPIEQASNKVSALLSLCRKRQEKETRIALYSKAAEAIEPLTRLDRVVEDQLSTLISRLDDTTIKWKSRLYKPAVVDAPDFHRSDVKADGRVGLISSFAGTVVESQHIANASDLRATLLAFLFAFIEHVLAERGGVALLMLDDPQDLFDKFNRRFVAAALPALLTSGVQVLTTTNDESFRVQVRQSIRDAEKADTLQQLEIAPAHRSSPVATLSPLYEDVDELRKKLGQPAGHEDDELARRYGQAVRIYAERSLLDSLDVAGLLVQDPTLDKILRTLQPLVGRSQAPFSGNSWRHLLKEFPPSSRNPTLELLSRTHHGSQPQVVFREVYDERDRLRRLCDLVKEARYEVECWFRQASPEPEAGDERELRPPLPTPLEFPLVQLPIVSKLAAFSAEAPTSLVEDEGDLFDPKWFENKALFGLNTDNFGFAGAPGNVAVVDLSNEEVEDGRLVIAHYRDKIFARRLLRFGGRSDVIGLSSEVEDPRDRRQSLILPTREVQLFKVMGILFDEYSPTPADRNEAVYVDHTNLLDQVEMVFRVDGESALPLALAGQWILGGRPLTSQDLPAYEGKLIAVATESEGYLKRVGAAVGTDGSLRLFESIGFTGASKLLSIGTGFPEPKGVEAIVSTRLVLGVLYDRSSKKGGIAREPRGR